MQTAGAGGAHKRGSLGAFEIAGFDPQALVRHVRSAAFERLAILLRGLKNALSAPVVGLCERQMIEQDRALVSRRGRAAKYAIPHVHCTSLYIVAARTSAGSMPFGVPAALGVA